MTDTTRPPSAADPVEELRRGNALDFGRDLSLMTLRLLELLAVGRPIPRDKALAAIEELDIDHGKARAFLDSSTERTEDGEIAGFGLTCNLTGHHVTIDGARMSTWCAMDTMIFAIVLGRTLLVESTAPGTEKTVHLTAHPYGPVDIDPPTAVITWPRRSKDEVDLESVSGIQATLCNHSLLFATRDEAQRWAAGRDDIAILSVRDGFDIARAVAEGFLRYRQQQPSSAAREPVPQLLKGRAAAGLTSAARHVHRRVLHEFAATGRAPAPAELRGLAREHGADPDAVLTELAESDVIAFDDAGQIRAAYSFSPAPTAIRMTWPGGPTVHAMCAIDALGTSAMLNRPIVITASDPSSGEAITVEVDGDHALWDPDTAVVFTGASGEACCAPSADRTCGNINFFATASAARTWAEAHPDVSWRVLGQQEALALAVDEFGALLYDA